MKQPPTSIDPRATREYRELGFKIVKCPVCEKETLDGYFICLTAAGNTTVQLKKMNIPPVIKLPLLTIEKVRRFYYVYKMEINH